jgi:hypothetical protein
MNKKEIIDQEVQKTLHCFAPLDKLSAHPYFYTRLQARLDIQQKEKEHEHKFFSPRLWRPALIGIMVVLNLTTAVLVYVSSEQNMPLTTDTLSTLAAEYDLNQDYSDLFIVNK